jgi:hypothetical protein
MPKAIDPATLTLPIVHSNGTSKRELIDLRTSAAYALREALEALKQMAPNGRDYYVSREGAAHFNRARAQHERRLAAVDQLRRELEAEAEALDCM